MSRIAVFAICAAWMALGVVLGFVAGQHTDSKRGLIVCTGYQKAYLEHITIDGNNLFVGSRTTQQVADEIAKAICRDMGI